MALPLVYYAFRCVLGLVAPRREMEIDGELVGPNIDIARVSFSDDVLAIENETWVAVSEHEATWGRVEFVPDDDSDNCLFWEYVDGLVNVRVFGTLLQIDLRYCNQPDCPRSGREGGAE